MKTSLTYHKLFLGFASAVLLLVSVSAAKAQTQQILLTVNITDPSAVTITATGADSSATVDAYLADGVDLLNLFQTSAGPVSFNVTSQGLTSADNVGGDVYTQSLADDYSGGNVDLNLYNSASAATEDFSAGSPAFTGTLTLNLATSQQLTTGFVLQTNGYTGTIISGFENDGSLGSGSPNTVIGKYQVVSDSISAPEPSTWVLLFGGVALLVVVRPRWKALRVRAARA